MPRLVTGVSSVGLIVLSAGVAWGQAHSTSSGQGYPTKPIRFVTAGLGGGNDFVLRQLTPMLSSGLGQQMIVDNRGGGSIPVEIVAKSLPDGYTLLAHSNSVWTAPFLRKLDYDPVKDLAPVSLVAKAPYVLIVHPSVAANSVRELIALAKASPGKLNYAMTSAGGGAHLAGELFTAMAGVNIVRVPYKSSSQQNVDLLSGQVQMTFNDPGSLAGQVKAGKLKALGVASTQPSALAPGLPTIASTLPGFEAAQYIGIYAPAKTPPAIINRLSQEFSRIVTTPDVKEKLFSGGFEAVGSTPQQFAAVIKADMASTGKIVKDANIRSD